MSSRVADKRTATAFRGIGFAVALVLGGVGAWLIVTSGNSTQRIEIGVLTGLWGLLLGAICGRRVAVSQHANVHVAQSASPPTHTDLAAPVATGLDRAEAARVRRAFAAELHAMLRRELANAVDNAISREVGELRAEIAELRSELLERVSGQLQLQRIETTTLIGSDLDAIRAEVRGLHDALEPPTPEPPVPEPPTLEPLVPEPPLDRPPVQRFTAPPVQLPASFAADPFAAMPKLTPFTAFPLDPIEMPAQTEGSGGFGQPPVPQPTRPAGTVDGTGGQPGGRRRRGDDPEGQELLARLLARERAGR